MEEITWEMVASEAGDKNNIIVPVAIDCNCPYCDRVVHFKVGWTGTPYNTYISNAKCSGCEQSPLFVYIASSKDKSSQIRGDIFIYPKSKRRTPHDGLNSLQTISTQIIDEYNALIRIYNLQEWIPASVMCRRILEALLQNLVPKEHHNKVLHQQILILEEHNDLKRPIKDIADVLRIAGNKGAHFDPINKPTRHTLELMIDLIDYLIEYFFILPAKTDALRSQVSNLSHNES